MTSIRFQANLAGVNTAAKPVSFGIEGDAKIALEADGSQTDKIVALLALGKTPLIVTVEIDEERMQKLA